MSRLVPEEARLVDGPAAGPCYVFAHGAGAPMDSPFMTTVAAGLASCGIGVVRFEFPYMFARRSGSRRPPDREPVLREAWREVVESLAGRPLVIGGKSMGGRIATLVADSLPVRGVVCFGYPFHPPGKPEQLRTSHLATIVAPLLIVQGTRDKLGSREEVESFVLSPSVRLQWIPDGDHSLVPRRSSGETEAGNLERAVAAAASFILELAS